MSDTAMSDERVAALVTRRRRVREWLNASGKGASASWTDAKPLAGLALSGGGIRSATYNLGLIQALARSDRDALAEIDLLSTVSGGGYIGSFLRSLFVPGRARGIDTTPKDMPDPASAEWRDAVADQYRFARIALASSPCEREFRPGARNMPEQVRNPLWWLREHSRYLAPSGPTDYGYAVAYLTRNWLAMLFLFTLASVALGTVLLGVEALALRVHWIRWPADVLGGWPLSPVVLLLPIPITISAVLSLAYWATHAMSTNEADVARQRSDLGRGALDMIGAGGGVLGVLLLVIAAIAIAPHLLPHGPAPSPADVLGRRFIGLVVGLLLACLVAGAVAWFWGAAWLRRQKPDAPTRALLTAELRRKLTKAVATANYLQLIVIALVVLDSVAAWLDQTYRAERLGRVGTGAAMLPVFAFALHKLQEWFGGKAGGSGMLGGMLRRFASTVALLVGGLLFAMLAIAALALDHHVTWGAARWSDDPTWARLLLTATSAWLLAVIIGRATGFINLSSLHTFYASRLTRAYLGASNLARLDLGRAKQPKHPRPINENDPADYIQPRVYGEMDLPAPVHLIHTTLNETIDPRSQIVTRDRKGDILTLEPGGVRVGDVLNRWDRLEANKAQNISLGQWIAISGAAASSGMGRLTNLGYALALTFANVRLGYWWDAPYLCPDAAGIGPVAKGIVRWFGTYSYLWNEMLARYSRGYKRKYLTDGGHYENSGAYALIRRGVPLTIVTDCGADPDGKFEDLQTLVRQVRIDLGGETTILGGPALWAYLDTLGVAHADRGMFADPVTRPDWRTRMRDPAVRAFVLALEVLTRDGERLHLLWIKPAVIPGLPSDVAGYAALTGDFPQQTTGDQFFDEAQWESYRKLGELSMTALLAACPLLLAPQLVT